MALDANTDISKVQRTDEAKPEKQSLQLSSMKLSGVLFTLAKCPAKRILPQDEHVSEQTLILTVGFKKLNLTFCSGLW